MSSVVCKQERALKGRILSICVLAFSVLFLFMTSEPILSRLSLFFISVFIFGFSVSYKINHDFNNQKLFSVFGRTLFTVKLKLEYPEYISVFSASLSLDNEWGSIAAIGTKEKQDKFVVRFFTGNKNFTLYRTENYQEALDKAKELGELLELEIYNAVEK